MGAVFSAGSIPLLGVLIPLVAPILADPANLARAAYLALGPTVLGYILFGYALIKLAARDVTVITLLEPVATVVIAVAILHETLPVSGWIGVATLIGGVAVVSLGYSATPRNSAD
jgi:DME family drug/metabolite transporter